MTRSVRVASLLVVTLVCSASARVQFASENAAMGVLDRLLSAVNARDDEAMCRTFHYPYIRFSSGAVRIYESHEDCVTQFDFVRFAERFGWDHSGWDRRTVVQANPSKVHVMVILSRYDDEDARIAQFDSFYIVTRVDGLWGIRLQSSLRY